MCEMYGRNSSCSRTISVDLLILCFRIWRIDTFDFVLRIWEWEKHGRRFVLPLEELKIAEESGDVRRSLRVATRSISLLPSRFEDDFPSARGAGGHVESQGPLLPRENHTCHR